MATIKFTKVGKEIATGDMYIYHSAGQVLITDERKYFELKFHLEQHGEIEISLEEYQAIDSSLRIDY